MQPNIARDASTPGSFSPLHARGYSAVALLSACGLVATAYWLGASWLSDPVLGIPTGVWATVVLFGVIRWGDSLVLDGAIRRAMGFAQSGRNTGAGLVGRFVSRCRESAVNGCRAWSEARRKACRNLADRLDPDRAVEDEIVWRPGPNDEAPIAMSTEPKRAARREGVRVRIGVAAGGVVASGVIRGGRACPGVGWLRLEPGAGTPQNARRMGFDAIVHDASERGIVVSTYTDAEHASRPADWARPDGVGTYASVFPTRYDPEQVTLGHPRFEDPYEHELAGALASAAAGAVKAGDGNADASSLFLNLRDVLVRGVLRQDSPAMLVPAARAVSGWFVCCDRSASVDERLEGVEAAARVLGDDPVVLMRLAAARFAASRDEEGHEALHEAFRLLTQREDRVRADQYRFIQSEIEHADEHDPMVVGRLAAGMALIAASSEPGSLNHLRGDIADDLDHAAWLVGRDQDKALILEALRRVSMAASVAKATPAAA